MNAVAMPLTTPAAVIESYLTLVLNCEDPAVLERLIANSVLRQRVSALHRAFPDLRVVAQQLVADGDLVAVHATAGGTHLGIYEGVPPTGRRWTATFTGIYRVFDGSIVDFWETWDGLAILEQIKALSRVAGASA